MKTTPEGHGDTIPGGLGPPIKREKPWTDLDERRKRREIQERAGHEVVDGYRRWVGPDGKMNCEKV
jgi:hypothetical protein